MTSKIKTSNQHTHPRPLSWLFVVMVALISGCVTPWEKSALLSDSKLPSIDRIQGPTQRSMTNFFRKKREEEDLATGGVLKPIAGEEEYLAATETFKTQDYAKAQKEFKKVAKKFKKSEIREDALFMQAEAAWQQEHYASAHDIYAVLLKEYPSSRHLNVVSERLFKIGRQWLDFPEVAKLGEIQQANFDDPSKPLPSDEKPKVPNKRVFIPNFSDKKEPLFDTAGNGVAALSAVWMNDPTGPLADDAMMLVASYHARRGNYIEADRHFQNLRELYPNSPHVQNAFLLGSHVKLMAYQGPEYESRTLMEAQLLKQSILNLYPNIAETERLKSELAHIEDSKAEIVWSQATFYERKGNKRACAIFCHELISDFPKSRFAEAAREKLAELGPEYESGAIFLTSKEVKNQNWMERFLEGPFQLRKYPVIGNPKYVDGVAQEKNPPKKSTSTPSADEESDATSKPPKSGKSKLVPEEDDLVPEEEVAPPTRRRGSQSSPPERLPESADNSSDEIQPAGVVRTRR